MANTEKMTVTPSKIFLEVLESKHFEIAQDSTNGDKYAEGLILEKDANGKLVAYGTTMSEGETPAPVGTPYAVLMEDVDVKSAAGHAEVLMMGSVDVSKLFVFSEDVTVAGAVDELRKNNIICKEVL